LAQTYGFFNSDIVEGRPDRPYDASEFAKYFSAFIGNGVFAHNLNELKPVSNQTSMTIKIQSGRAYVNGYWFESDEDVIVSFDGNVGQASSRYDGVVVTFDFTNRQAQIEVVKGTTATSYEIGKQNVYNNLSRTETKYQLCLAIVKIPENASTYSIDTTDIYDVRAEMYCGWVIGLVDQIDSSTIVTQLQAEFDAWFQNMKDQLSSDAAGSLQNQINSQAETMATLANNILMLEQRVESNYNEIDTLRQNVVYLSPFTLFEKTSGASGYIQLNRSMSEFNELEIYFMDNNSKTTNVVRVSNLGVDKQIVLSLIGDVNNYATYIRRATYILAENSLELKENSESITSIAKYATSETGECATKITYGQGQYVKITKVVGLGDKNYTPVVNNRSPILQTANITNKATAIVKEVEQ
jgi:hypothetical protein